jgi:hypothetical protein
MPWKSRRLEPLEQDLAALRSELIKLRHELRTKQTALGGLELALRERSERIDELANAIAVLRDQNRRLAEMVRLG